MGGSEGLSTPWESTGMHRIWEWWWIGKSWTIKFQLPWVGWGVGMYLWETEIYISEEKSSSWLRKLLLTIQYYLFSFHCFFTLSSLRYLVSTHYVPGTQLCADDTRVNQTGITLSYGPYTPEDLWVCEQCLLLCKKYRYGWTYFKI